MLNEQKWGEKLPDNEYDYLLFLSTFQNILWQQGFLHLDIFFFKKKSK